jgi:hypothetical protein
MTANRTTVYAVVAVVFAFAGLGACGSSADEPQPAREPTQQELEAGWKETQPIIKV